MRGKRDAHCQAFVHEKAVTLALRGNPWHAQLVSTFSSENNLYMLLEYCPALSLDQHIERGRGLRNGAAGARFYTACVLLALEHMHQVGGWGLRARVTMVDGQGREHVRCLGLASSSRNVCLQPPRSKCALHGSRRFEP
jgi:serine/threonine protein kinase